MNRIFYECRDLNVPSGGIRRLYRHVEILNKNGFSAYILHLLPSFKPTWFEADVPITYWDGTLKLDSDDVLVIPEGHVDIIARTAHAEFERVIIALNWANIYTYLPVGR